MVRSSGQGRMAPVGDTARDTAELLVGALRVIDEALALVRGVRKYVPLFSGGHDSYCATYVASQHPRFDGNIYHIDTGIGSRATRAFVEGVCRDEGWTLNVLKSPYSLEGHIRAGGFPGPSRHWIIYRLLKDKCIDQITKAARGHYRSLLVTGMRSKESTRRMSYGDTVKMRVGEVYGDGKVHNKHRVWISPCHDWSTADQRAFMDDYALPRNPIKESVLGKSGECFCGCFARPYELDAIREVCPDVAVELDRLAAVARDCGKSPDACVYGGPRAARGRGVDILRSGPLCTSCDNKAEQAGIRVVYRGAEKLRGT